MDGVTPVIPSASPRGIKHFEFQRLKVLFAFIGLERGGEAIATGSGKKKQEKQLQQQAQTAYQEIKPSDYELYQKPKDLQFIKDLDTGKDVRDIDQLRWHLNLFDNAQKDPNLSGMGLLGQNQLTGANSNLMGLIGQQIAGRQQQQAQGDLYNAVQDTRGETFGRLGDFSNMEASRQMGRAGLANQMFTSYLHRPKKPSLFEQILGGGAQVAAGFI